MNTPNQKMFLVNTGQVIERDTLSEILMRESKFLVRVQMSQTMEYDQSKGDLPIANLAVAIWLVGSFNVPFDDHTANMVFSVLDNNGNVKKAKEYALFETVEEEDEDSNEEGKNTFRVVEDAIEIATLTDSTTLDSSPFLKYLISQEVLTPEAISRLEKRLSIYKRTTTIIQNAEFDVVASPNLVSENDEDGGIKLSTSTKAADAPTKSRSPEEITEIRSKREAAIENITKMMDKMSSIHFDIDLAGYSNDLTQPALAPVMDALGDIGVSLPSRREIVSRIPVLIDQLIDQISDPIDQD